MKENLFFKASKFTSFKKPSYRFLNAWILLLLLSIPISFSAKALEMDSVDQGDSGIVYVGANTVIYGLSHISNAHIINIEKVEAQKAPVKARLRTIAQQVKTKKSSQDLKFKKIQQEVNARIVYSFFISQDLQSHFFKHSNLTFGISCVVNAPFKIIGNLPLSTELNQNFGFEIENYTSYFSHFTLPLYMRGSFSLRGPPLS